MNKLQLINRIRISAIVGWFAGILPVILTGLFRGPAIIVTVSMIFMALSAVVYLVVSLIQGWMEGWTGATSKARRNRR